MEKSSNREPIKAIKTDESATNVPIQNAGLVILNSYIPILFERLQLTHEKQFTSLKNQQNAVQYLQYLATGSSKTEQTYLSLNKILCGLNLNSDVPDEIVISAENKQLYDSLIEAAIAHWSIIGKCSIDGFRSNWLVRDGLLKESEDKWELIVDKRAYDLLIARSPFSFSVIKFPWMNKPLYVNWPF
jgi:hypothetical protein